MTYGSSKWLEGATAAREFKPVTACPYEPISYDFVVWHNGWAFARYQMAQEGEDIL